MMERSGGHGRESGTTAEAGEASAQARPHRETGGQFQRGRPHRIASLAVVVLAVGSAALVLALWSRIDAQVRAALVLTSVTEAPVATPVAGTLTGEPRVETTSLAGNPTSVFVPAGDGPHPAILFANGTIPQGREYEGVRNLATGFARAGYLVVVPDLPGLRTDAITPNTVSETVEVALEVSERTDAKNGRVGLVGVSTGATLALLAAESPVLRGRVSAVAGIAPYTDIRTVLAIATTGHYKLDGRMVPYRAEPFLSYVIARSLVSALPPGEDRRTLLRELDAVERSSPTPLADLRERSARDLGPEARSVLALLANRDPERFATLYRDLPPNIKAA